MELPANVLSGFLELIHALSQTPGEVWQLFRSEEDEHDEEDYKQIRATGVTPLTGQV